jgi:hypothetical protein
MKHLFKDIKALLLFAESVGKEALKYLIMFQENNYPMHLNRKSEF